MPRENVRLNVFQFEIEQFRALVFLKHESLQLFDVVG
jgi:hypothetical protein